VRARVKEFHAFEIRDTPDGEISVHRRLGDEVSPVGLRTRIGRAGPRHRAGPGPGRMTAASHDAKSHAAIS
jgi:hypothetical protein